MNKTEFIQHLKSLVGIVAFDYEGKSGAIDPIGLTRYDCWYGDQTVTLESIEAVMSEPFLAGQSLENCFDRVRITDW